MNKKIMATLLAVGLMAGSAISTTAYTLTGSCEGIGCSAVLNHNGKRFRAGTYANHTMANISVKLDGESEWWADEDNRSNSKSAYMETTIASMHAYSDHHADDNNGDDFDRGIEYKNDGYSRR